MRLWQNLRMRLDHAAYPCRDPEATHRFYSGLLGLQLIGAIAGEDLMLIYRLPEGGNLVFTAVRNPLVAVNSGADWEKQHLGLTVSTRAELEAWSKRLEDYGVKYRWVDDERIYFSDPDGVFLELEVESPLASDPKALDKMQRWLAGKESEKL